MKLLAQANDAAKAVGTVPKGEELVVLGPEENGFIHVQGSSATGWVRKSSWSAAVAVAGSRSRRCGPRPGPIPHAQHDLADVGAGLHEAVGGAGIAEVEHGVNAGPRTARVEDRPDPLA